MNYYAHITENKKQTIKDHDINTATLGKDFSIDWLQEIVYVAGLMHDVGKYQFSFQKRLNGENVRIEHSICGAKEAEKLYHDEKLVKLILEYIIAGHHSGIPDGGSKIDSEYDATLSGRLKRKTESFDTYKEDILLPDLIRQNKEILQIIRRYSDSPDDIVDIFAFIVRYCFSCLTDADSLDTASFCSGVTKKHLKADFASCLNDINDKLKSFHNITELQNARGRLQKQAFDKINLDANIYYLNLPTGGGKTLCSIKFALERALIKGKKHIIYVCPFNSIIEQTAREMSELFSRHSDILQHTSSFNVEDIDRDEDYKSIVKLSMENWDADIIITTFVQFFESIYANKRNKLRKVHNIADSILIFDEAHMMPLEFLQPCLQAISYFSQFMNCEAVFLTATMPDFKILIDNYALKNLRMISLINDTSDFRYFKKCSFAYIEDISDENLLQNAMSNPSSLIILNKKRTAQELYNKCVAPKKIHLSTYMTVSDRSDKIIEIKEYLKALSKKYPNLQDVPEEERMIVFSTSLVEAGVDFDFSTVFRELNTLESIIQSGGRCNREGKEKNAITYVFTRNESKQPIDYKMDMTREIVRNNSDITEPKCIREYYNKVFEEEKESITGNSIHAECKSLESIPFAQYAAKFEMIDSNNVSIIIPQDKNCKKLIDKLRFSGIARERDFQKYTCSISQKEFQELFDKGVLDDYESGMYFLTNMDYYSSELGIQFSHDDYYL